MIGAGSNSPSGSPGRMPNPHMAPWAMPQSGTQKPVRGNLPHVDNPWRLLRPAPPYLLDIDRAILRGGSDLRLDLPPVPFVGSPEQAEVVVLLTNPGVASSHEGGAGTPYAQ